MKNLKNLYPCRVEMVKYFLSGRLEGERLTDRTCFLSWDDACKWAGGATMNVSCPYVVLEMRDLETGTVEKF